MKKSTIFGIIAVLVSIVSFAFCNEDNDVSFPSPIAAVHITTANPNVSLVNLNGSEIAFFVNYNKATRGFKEFYLFQYRSFGKMLDVKRVASSILVQAEDTYIRVNIDGKLCVFTVNENYTKRKNETVYYGEGLSRRVAGSVDYKFVNEKKTVSNLVEIISVYGNTTHSDSECRSGGIGSISCSVKINGALSSVSCSKGYYACCNERINNCECIEENPKMGKGKALKKAEFSLKQFGQ